MKRQVILLISVIFLINCFGCGQQSADLVIINGKVATVDDNLPEAEAIAVKGYKILKVGSNDEIKALATSSTKTIDVQGKLVIPGIIEGHGHFGSLGNSLMRLNFMKVKNFDEIVAMVSDVKSQEIVREHALQDLVFLGAYPEDLVTGPGDVPEMRYDQLSGGHFFQILGQHGKMIILYPHKRLLVAYFLKDLLRELFVYLAVAMEFFPSNI